jgi:hypothetical protein
MHLCAQQAQQFTIKMDGTFQVIGADTGITNHGKLFLLDAIASTHS